MLLVHLPLTTEGLTPGTDREAGLLQDVLWAHARPPHALEHVRIRPIAHGLNVAMFVRADCDTTARAQARSLLNDALAAGALRGYSLAPEHPA
ncbi:hypothetical protein LG634_35970 [Streptomyces bambusae]|uniref:hypothetical protein n=1 Tax=Streptomyces bambusae TaxID=1550616 RepID=UPI001CFFE468|nr:hypothetical protein [Streptomyces bambusae]MCB5170183.1 hypothetical protein [Streptomyces bambusae]